MPDLPDPFIMTVVDTNVLLHLQGLEIKTGRFFSFRVHRHTQPKTKSVYTLYLTTTYEIFIILGGILVRYIVIFTTLNKNKSTKI